MNNESEIVEVLLDDIIPNRFQPREIFEDAALKELAASIKEHGVIQPIIVRNIGDKYEIIAGERRYKATTLAGLTKIPAIVRNLDDKESSKVALLENLQRKDLNPIEEARTFQKILELDPITQEQLAVTMGKSQSSIANKLRLLSLPIEIQDALLQEKISEKHARTLLNLNEKEQQIAMLDKIITNKMTVRELDLLIKGMSSNISETINTPSINISNNIYKSPNSINEIKSAYEDILPPEKPLANLDSLLKTNDDAPFKEQDYKFIPSFDDEIKEVTSENVVVDTPAIINSFEKVAPKEEFKTDTMFIDSIKTTPVVNEEPESIINNEVEDIESLDEKLESLNNISNVLINNNYKNNAEALDVFDLKSAINTTRDLIKKIERSGFIVDTEEMDFEDKYKIIITIDKN
ncbi:MAG: ParB/RepB/Spo0J family partition protein [Bacilli bacterium]